MGTAHIISVEVRLRAVSLTYPESLLDLAERARPPRFWDVVLRDDASERDALRTIDTPPTSSVSCTAHALFMQLPSSCQKGHSRNRSIFWYLKKGT